MLRNIIKARSTRAIIVLALAITAVPGSGAAARGGSLAVNDGPTGCQPTASTPVPQPTQAQLDVAGLGDLPLAPNSARRDLVAAPFNDPTAVDNPLFPISDLHSAILNGHVDGKVFHTETTLLPFTKIIEWTPGQCVRVLVSQYMAFLDGNLQETAIDLYAQADDGSVWYLGEDVNDYSANGFIVTTEGTWQAGIDGPFAMIMPSDPQVGDAVILRRGQRCAHGGHPFGRGVGAGGTAQRREEIAGQQVFEQRAFERAAIVERSRLLQRRARADVGRMVRGFHGLVRGRHLAIECRELRSDRSKRRPPSGVGPFAGADERRIVHHRSRFAEVVQSGPGSGVFGVGTACPIRRRPAILGGFRQRIDGGRSSPRLPAVSFWLTELRPLLDEIVW